MLFMLHIDVSLPADMPLTEKENLRQRENARALELVEARKLRRIWRIVGRVANYSVWEEESLEALHAAIQSLPLFPYMKVEVTPLIEHPVTEAWRTQKKSALPAI
jgi:muconolactone D-isomerase